RAGDNMRACAYRQGVMPMSITETPAQALDFTGSSELRVVACGEPPVPSPPRGRSTHLIGRDTERHVLGRLLETVRGGESRALVVHGETGVGKTALLDYFAARVSDAGCRVVSAAGVQSEMELAFAALHQLCAPLLDRLEMIPAPQRDALRTTFALSAGPVPDRFLVGLAVLSLLAEVAA